MQAVIAHKGKGLWPKLKEDNCFSEIKEQATAFIVNALGDSASCVCCA